MARIFKRTYRDKATGKLEKTPKFYVEFRDHHDLYKRLPATVDKSGSETIGRHVEKLVACRLARIEPTGDLAEWLEALPGSFITRLVALDLLDSRRLAAGRPLADHLADFRAWMTEKRRNTKHVETTLQRVGDIVTAAGAVFWSSLTSDRIAAALSKVQREQGLADVTRNAYLTALKAFCNWMVKDRRASSSPAIGVDTVELAEREHRRALSSDEAPRLLAAAAAGVDRFALDRQGRHRWHMTGLERAALFSVVLQTAFRAGAARRLTVADFALEGDTPTVTLPGKQATKNKRDMTQALQPRTAALLKRLFAGKLPTSPAFNMPDSTETAELVRGDLEAARAAWIAEGTTPEDKAKRAASSFLAAEDESGRVVDFHALRTTTGTMLALLDIPRAVTTRIMGHANYATTDKYYNRPSKDDRRTAVDRLPDLTPQVAQLRTRVPTMLLLLSEPVTETTADH